MSLNRYAKKRDAAEKEVFDALRHSGFSVEPMDRPVDAIVGFKGICFLVEVKSGDKGYGKALNTNQQKFADRWNGPEVVILRSAEDAIDWIATVKASIGSGKVSASQMMFLSSLLAGEAERLIAMNEREGTLVGSALMIVSLKVDAAFSDWQRKCEGSA